MLDVTFGILRKDPENAEVFNMGSDSSVLTAALIFKSFFSSIIPPNSKSALLRGGSLYVCVCVCVCVCENNIISRLTRSKLDFFFKRK